MPAERKTAVARTKPGPERLDPEEITIGHLNASALWHSVQFVSDRKTVVQGVLKKIEHTVALNGGRRTWLRVENAEGWSWYGAVDSEAPVVVLS